MSRRLFRTDRASGTVQGGVGGIVSGYRHAARLPVGARGVSKAIGFAGTHGWFPMDASAIVSGQADTGGMQIGGPGDLARRQRDAVGGERAGQQRGRAVGRQRNCLFGGG